MSNGYPRKQKTSKTDHFDPLNVAYVWLLLSHIHRLLVAYMRLHICGSYFDFTVVTRQLKHGREYVLLLHLIEDLQGALRLLSLLAAAVLHFTPTSELSATKKIVQARKSHTNGGQPLASCYRGPKRALPTSWKVERGRAAPRPKPKPQPSEGRKTHKKTHRNVADRERRKTQWKP